jgi:hypothetical protein
MILVWHKFTAMIVWNNSYAYIHNSFPLLLIYSASLFADDIPSEVTSLKTELMMLLPSCMNILLQRGLYHTLGKPMS